MGGIVSSPLTILVTSSSDNNSSLPVYSQSPDFIIDFFLEVVMIVACEIKGRSGHVAGGSRFF
jgi:hypothetical protein